MSCMLGVVKIISKNEDVLSEVMIFFKDACVANTLRLTHHNNPRLYIATKKNILLMIQAFLRLCKTTSTPISSTPAFSTAIQVLSLRNF